MVVLEASHSTPNHFAYHDVYVFVGNHGPMIEQLDECVIIIRHLVGQLTLNKIF